MDLSFYITNHNLTYSNTADHSEAQSYYKELHVERDFFKKYLVLSEITEQTVWLHWTDIEAVAPEQFIGNLFFRAQYQLTTENENEMEIRPECKYSVWSVDWIHINSVEIFSSGKILKKNETLHKTE